MSKYKLLFCLFTFVFPLIGCRPAQVVVPSVQAPSPKTYNSEISQDDLDKLSFAFCSEGNCPCGDGYCSQGSYCINDMCFCGAHPDEGYFDQETIASNNYGEFKCVTYKVGCFDNSTTNFPPDLIKYAKRILKYHEICSNVRNGKVVLHDFICARKNGCKTDDGRKYSKLKDIPESLNETGTMEFNSPWWYGNFREGNDRKTPVDDIALSSDYYFSSQNTVSGYYQAVLKQRCGEPVPADDVAGYHEGIQEKNIPKFHSSDMFKGTKLETLASEKPLKTRKAK